MTTFQSIVYGIIHAVTIWLPVSESAHYWMVSKLLDWPEPSGVFYAALLLGTFLAGFVFYIHDWLSMASSTLRMLLFWKAPNSIDERLPFFLILTTLPWLLVELFFSDSLHEWLDALHATHGPSVWGYALAGIMLIGAIPWALSFSLNRQNKNPLNWNWLDAIWVGLGQLLHFIPGAGRQLGFLSVAFLRGFNREAAWKYATLSMTCMTGALAAIQIHRHGEQGFESLDFSWLSFSVALGISFLVSLLMLNAATRGAERARSQGVSRYRVLAGILIAAWTFFRP